MQIDENLLLAWGATTKHVAKGEAVFYQGDRARYYYQVIKGKIKLININDEGKEFVQGVFTDGNSFGEPPLFIDQPYPSTAIAVNDSIVLRLAKDTFFKVLEDYPSISSAMLKAFAQRIYNKSVTTSSLINCNPESRILSFFDSFKDKIESNNGKILIPYTRQEIANFTGLRVETVIRTIMKMSNEKKLEITNRKVYIPV